MYAFSGDIGDWAAYPEHFDDYYQIGAGKDQLLGNAQRRERRNLALLARHHGQVKSLRPYFP
jgi:hypothetical protein